MTVLDTRRADVVPDETPEFRFVSPRRRLHGWGLAEVIELPAPWRDHVHLVTDRLAALRGRDELDGRPGSGPVAFAALPFDPSRPAQAFVPRWLAGSTPDGSRWVTGPAGATVPPELSTAPDVAAHTATSARVDALGSAEAWCEQVREATRRIRAGDLTKVVLARELRVTHDAPIDPHALADRVAEAFPHAMCFDIDGFVGASPELLVSRFDDVVRAQPMAGTLPRTGDHELDQRRAAALLADHKSREEHQITIDMVHDALLDHCRFLDAQPSPTVVAAGPVQHLATLVEGRLGDPLPTALDLVARLHPTPAVGGWPTGRAIDAINELEAGDRGRYAGPVGWIDSNGNGAFAVGVRSASITHSTAAVWAGVGVVAESDPIEELEETRAKFATMLTHLTRL
ncbi:MAG: isochorismate synthase [Microthrixaceae bacterium]|nr:isochorismate synthase [Microthrixaceae bacterium]HMT26226.1 isochorismate synthase [Microthrixaceae bacterium]HMT62027.1 isochorismate synthase [Microthrixaceae bacterium]